MEKRMMFCAICPSYRSRRLRALMTTLLTHPSKIWCLQHCLSFSWSVLGQCLWYILSFLITKCGFITHGPVMPFWSFSCFQPELPLQSEALVIPCFTVKAFHPSSTLSIWGLSQHLCPQSLWPVGLQDCYSHEVAVWMLIVSEEFVLNILPSFLFITLFYIKLFSTYWPLSGCQSI